MTIFYLDTYDAPSKFDISDEDAQILFKTIESELTALGYNVALVEGMISDNLTDSDDANIEYRAEADYLNILKKLDRA